VRVAETTHQPKSPCFLQCTLAITLLPLRGMLPVTITTDTRRERVCVCVCGVLEVALLRPNTTQEPTTHTHTHIRRAAQRCSTTHAHQSIHTKIPPNDPRGTCAGSARISLNRVSRRWMHGRKTRHEKTSIQSERGTQGCCVGERTHRGWVGGCGGVD
jgi:hypothetical protein